MKVILFSVVILCGLPEVGIAACSDTIVGQSEKYSIVISDEDCQFDIEMIQITEIEEGKVDPPDYTKALPVVPFAEECRKTKTQIICKAGGRTVLAGVTYEITEDASPSCPGESVGFRYTCIKGCKTGVPKYLEIRSYEC